MRKPILLAVLMVFTTICSNAQQKATLDNSELVQHAAAQRETNFRAKSFTPNGKSNFSNVFSSASLTSSFKEGGTGKIELKYDKDWLTFGLSVNQSIGKGATEVSLFDFDGINSGTTVEFNIQKMFWNPVTTDLYFDKFIEAKNKFAKRLEKNARGITLTEILNDTTGNEKELIEDVVLKQPWFFNFSCSFNKNNYEYFTDSSSLVEIRESYISPNFKLSIGKPLANKNGIVGFLGISYTYAIRYSGGEELTLLSPFGTTSNYLSRTLTSGNPKKRIDNRVNVEWRRSIANVFAISPTITYGINSEKLALVLPIYFIKGSSKGLQGGIRLGYVTGTNGGLNSLKDGTGAEIIVCTPFDILGSLKD